MSDTPPLPAASKPYSAAWLPTLGLTAFWFGYNFIWNTLGSIVLPAQVSLLAPLESRNAILSLILMLGSALALFVQPLAGAFSDRSRNGRGRRHPFILYGSLACLIPLGMMASTWSIPLLLVGFMLLQLFANTAAAGFQGLIPDLVPSWDQDRISTVLAAELCLATILAAPILGYLADHGWFLLIYLVFALVFLLTSLISARFAKDCPSVAPPRAESSLMATFGKSLRTAFAHKPFRRLIVIYGLFTLGFYLIANYIQYYLDDVVKSANPAGDAALITVVVLLAAAVSSIFGGALAARIGKRWLLAGAAVLMLLNVFIFLCSPPLELLYLAAVFNGLGYGAYGSIQWSLVTRDLPGKMNAGQDMGVFNIALVAPQIVAPLIGGLVFLLMPVLGIVPATAYLVVFSLAGLLFAASGILALKVA